MNKKEQQNNMAFIDGQNLYLGTTTNSAPWVVDLFRFRVYLRKKYNVTTAYYFLGCINDDNQDLPQGIVPIPPTWPLKL